MPERDPMFGSYAHLAKFPRADEALHMLKKAASIVKPIMRSHGWKVGQLTEFYPANANLLGLNVGAGQKICLRLRYASDRTLFLSSEEVVDTLLHELTHIVHGPHDRHFHELWDKLRDEHAALLVKGYTGEGFLSDGNRLGGSKVPPHEARRLAREAAEKRRRQQAVTGVGGHRLGGARPAPGQDIRRVIANAVEARQKTLEGCATEKMSEKEISELAEQATRNGFRTQAEEDEANEAAIAQAMEEMLEEMGKNPGPSTIENPKWQCSSCSRLNSDLLERCAGCNSARAGKDVDRRPRASPEVQAQWACSTCTFLNTDLLLNCEMCETPRKKAAVNSKTTEAKGGNVRSAQKQPPVIDLTDSPPRKKTYREPFNTSHTGPATWTCSFCSEEVERQWWSCPSCGNIKDSSR